MKLFGYIGSELSARYRCMYSLVKTLHCLEGINELTDYHILVCLVHRTCCLMRALEAHSLFWSYNGQVCESKNILSD